MDEWSEMVKKKRSEFTLWFDEVSNDLERTAIAIPKLFYSWGGTPQAFWSSNDLVIFVNFVI